MKSISLVTFSFLILCSSYIFTNNFLKFNKSSSVKIDFEAENDEPVLKEKQEFLKLRDPNLNIIPKNIRSNELIFASKLKNINLLNKSSKIGLVWNNIGPYNLGGRTRALGLDVNDNNIIIAGSSCGGIFRSIDNGSSWNKVSKTNQLPNTTCLVQDLRKGKSKTWYCGTGEYRSPSIRFGNVLFSGDGIYKSIDNGLSWNLLSSTSTSKPNLQDNSFDFVYKVDLDFSKFDEDIVYAATYKGIRRSSNGGLTWVNSIGNDNTPNCYSDVCVTPSGQVYATMSSSSGLGGIYHSSDGNIWDKITPENFSDSTQRLVISFPPSNESLIYVLGQTHEFGKKIDGFYGFPEWSALLRYNINSRSWVNLSDNLPPDARNGFNSLNSYAMYLKFDPKNEKIAFLGSANLHVSYDAFETNNFKWIGGYPTQGNWDENGGLHPDQHSLVFSNIDSNIIYCGNDGGVKKINYAEVKTEGNNWIQLNNGYITSQFYSVSIDKSGLTNSVIGGAQDNGSWRSMKQIPNENWENVGSGDGCICSNPGGGSIYTSSQNGSIYRIDSSGGFDYINKSGDANYLFVNPFYMPDNDNMYIASGSYIKIVKNLNTNLKYDYNNPSPGIIMEGTRLKDNLQISALTTSGDNLYYGTTNGHIFKTNNKNDLELAAIEITGNEFPKNAYINCIASTEKFPELVLVVFTNYNVKSLFLSENGGKDWKDISANLEELADGNGSGPSCKWATIVTQQSKTEPYQIFVGTSIGLFSSSYNEKGIYNWSQEGANSIGNVIVDMIDINFKNEIAIATWGNGIYTSKFIPASILENSSSLKNAPLFQIKENIIENKLNLIVNNIDNFSIEKNINMYNNLGIKVFKKVVFVNPGKNNFSIDVSNLPNSNYFLEIDGKTKQFVIEK